MSISAKAPPVNETNEFTANSVILTSSNRTIDAGSKPNLPKDLINSIVPKKPAIDYQLNPSSISSKETQWCKNPLYRL
jgi:hypothetical protein